MAVTNHPEYKAHLAGILKTPKDNLRREVRWDHPEVEERWDDPDMWSVLPSRLYDRLDKVNPPITHKTAYGLGLAVYKGPRRANRALSNVALLWAREAADNVRGLPLGGG